MARDHRCPRQNARFNATGDPARVSHADVPFCAARRCRAAAVLVGRSVHAFWLSSAQRGPKPRSAAPALCMASWAACSEGEVAHPWERKRSALATEKGQGRRTHSLRWLGVERCGGGLAAVRCGQGSEEQARFSGRRSRRSGLPCRARPDGPGPRAARGSR